MSFASPRQLGVDAALILDTAHEAFVAMGVDGEIVEWNAAACQLFGWDRSEVVGRDLADVIIPERLREAHRRGLQRYFETGEGPVLEQRLELPALRRDGSEVEVEITISGVTAEAGHFFHAFLHDVSERAARDRLVASQLRVTEALAVADPNDALRDVLRVMCQEGGWQYGGIWRAGDAAEVLHGYCSWFDPSAVAPDFESASRCTGFYRGRGLPGLAWQTADPVWHWPTQDAEEFPRFAVARRSGLQSGMAVPLLAGREVVGILELFGTSPTTHGEAQRSLVQAVSWQIGEYMARRRAERSAAAEKDAFVANVSHELRTPLTAINGFAQTALDHWDELGKEKHQKFLEIILEQGTRLGRLVDELLTMERIQAHGIDPEVAPVRATEAVEETLVELGVEAHFAVRSDDGDVLVLADRDLYKQVVVNFVQNAVRYGAAPFEVEVEVADGMVRTSVTDHGGGVPSEFEPRLFERFSRADPSNSQPGTGLGLAIVMAIAEAQGGRVWHEAVRPNGARFTLELPRA